MIKIFIATGTLLTIFSTAIFAQDKKEQEMMKAWEKYMTPGKFHEMMAKDDGEWTGEVTIYSTPDGKPSKSTMTAKNSMIMGGRYQESINTGDFNGMPFEGRSITGYDNAKKKFFSNWIDNMGTGILNLEGTYDAKSKMLTMTGNMVDPMSGKVINVRHTVKYINDDTQLLTMYDIKNGKEMKSMEIKLTRNKG